MVNLKILKLTKCKFNSWVRWVFQRWIHAQLSVPIGRITARKSATKLTPTVTNNT